MSLADFKKALGSHKMVFGTEETLRHLRNGKTKKIFLAKNCETSAKESIKRYAAQGKVEVVELDLPRGELAVICKRNHPVSVISY